MKRLLMAAVLAGGIGWLVVADSAPGQAPGPDDGAVLKLPGSESPVARPAPPPAQTPSTVPVQPAGNSATGIMGMWNNQVAANHQNQTSLNRLPLPNEGPDPNQDILITQDQGPWVITVICYTAPNAPALAREMALELRNTYKLQAFVYNHGVEERRKEYERVKTLVEKRREALRQSNLTPDNSMRVSFVRIEEQCAVLVGGYGDENAARDALDGMRRLKPPDPNRVKLNIFSVLELDLKTKKTEQVNKPINPFSQAFVSRNPAFKADKAPHENPLDLASLKRLNADESFSLLQCKKPITLVVKQFQTDTLVTSKATTGTFLENLGMGGKTKDRMDGAAINAHNVAELLRKMSLKAYVLHTKNTSLVTVGEYDNINDPALKTMQSQLANRLSPHTLPQLAFVKFFPTPMPMQVPR